MNNFMAALVLAFISASPILAQEGGIDTTQRITAEVGRQETGAPSINNPELQLRVSRLESEWSDLQQQVRAARQRRDYRAARDHADRANKVSILIVMIKNQLPQKSGSATWGARSVQSCLDQGILVGRTKHTTADSKEWKSYSTREEQAAGLSNEAGLRRNADNGEMLQRQSADKILAGADTKETSDRQIADANETSERKTADANEANKRSGVDRILAWGIFWLAVIAGLGFFLHSLPDD